MSLWIYVCELGVGVGCDVVLNTETQNVGYVYRNNTWAQILDEMNLIENGGIIQFNKKIGL